MLQKNYTEKNKKRCIVFLHTAKSLKDENHILFSYNKQKFKKYILACIFDFNNKFIKVTKTRSIFQKFQKKYLFSFSIWDYEFIHKTYSRY